MLSREVVLEVQLELRLSLPLRVGLAVDHLSEVRIREQQSAGAAEYHAVQQIEVRETQLGGDVLGKREFLAERYVLIQIPGQANVQDAWSRTQRPESGVAEGGGIQNWKALVDVAVAEFLLNALVNIRAIARRAEVAERVAGSYH